MRVCFCGMLAFLSIASFVGCSRDQTSASSEGRDEVVLVRIGDWKLTTADVKAEVLIRQRLLELGKKKVPKGDAFPRWANSLARQLVPGLVNGYLWEHDAKRRGIEAEPEDFDKLLEDLKTRTRRKVADLSSFASEFGEQAETYRTLCAREARLMAYRRKVIQPEVDDEEIQDLIRMRREMVEKVKTIDELARSKGMEAWKKLNAGVSWEEVAKEYDEDALLDEDGAEYWKEWLSFRPQDSEYEELRALLPTIKAGGYTMPTEISDGMVIVKVLSIEDGVYTCVRILRRMGVRVTVPTIEEARAEILADKRSEEAAELTAQLKDAVQIDYPQGTNFTFCIWEEPPRKNAARNMKIRRLLQNQKNQKKSKE